LLNLPSLKRNTEQIVGKWNLKGLVSKNVAPEKSWLEDYFPFGMASFQGPNFPGVTYMTYPNNGNYNI